MTPKGGGGSSGIQRCSLQPRSPAPRCPRCCAGGERCWGARERPQGQGTAPILAFTLLPAAPGGAEPPVRLPPAPGRSCQRPRLSPQAERRDKSAGSQGGRSRAGILPAPAQPRARAGPSCTISISPLLAPGSLAARPCGTWAAAQKRWCGAWGQGPTSGARPLL